MDLNQLATVDVEIECAFVKDKSTLDEKGFMRIDQSEIIEYL